MVCAKMILSAGTPRFMTSSISPRLAQSKFTFSAARASINFSSGLLLTA